MANWRDSILEKFQRGIARLTLVADPDGLLTEEGTLTAIKDRGFDLIPFEDPIAFRYAYESKYRGLWDRGQQTDLVVVLHSKEQSLASLPYDLFRSGRHLEFALHRLFPKLSYPVIDSLDRSYLDSLFAAYQEFDGPALGERFTKEFVLTRCFGVVPKLIKTPVELTKVLLSRHYRAVAFPEILDSYLLETLRSEASFASWPLEEIVPGRERFLRFLQDQWPIYLASLKGEKNECIVPFGHEDVRVYIDNLFLEGHLTPVAQESVDRFPGWARSGVAHDPQADALRRWQRLRERFDKEIPNTEAPHRDWQRAATTWAELVVLRWELDAILNVEDRQLWDATRDQLQAKFADWMLARFGSLYNLPFHPLPVMVHQVPHYLAAQRTRNGQAKTALVVVDGLALDQWILVRHALATQIDWQFEESSLFAWVPTFTAVSRQSIFAGKPPLYFPASFETTHKEESHWSRFWEEHGQQRGTVGYVKGVESGRSAELESCLANPRLAVIGIVVNTVDEIMHGMQLGTAGMHDQVRLWAKQGHLASLVTRLRDDGFAVYLVADHGNVAATGIGSPREGVLVEVRGKRARVYDHAGFRDEVKASYPDSLEWPGTGLPPSRFVLLPRGLHAFTAEGELVVSHGGIALEEVIVPFIRIT